MHSLISRSSPTFFKNPPGAVFDNYQKIWKQTHSLSHITKIKALLKEYTKGDSFFIALIGRIVTGHWNRHHVKKINQLLKMKYESVDELIYDLKQIKRKSGGELDRCIQFIEQKIDERHHYFNKNVIFR